jgi:hypothetical protein
MASADAEAFPFNAAKLRRRNRHVISVVVVFQSTNSEAGQLTCMWNESPSCSSNVPI